MGQPRPLFSVFSNKQSNFYSNSMQKKSIQYTEPGLEPTRVVTHNHYTRAPALVSNMT